MAVSLEERLRHREPRRRSFYGDIASTETSAGLVRSNRCGSPIRNPRRFRAECGAGDWAVWRRPAHHKNNVNPSETVDIDLFRFLLVLQACLMPNFQPNDLLLINHRGITIVYRVLPPSRQRPPHRRPDDCGAVGAAPSHWELQLAELNDLNIDGCKL